ncbi:MAG: hypothetical protein A2V70_20275 [Planctomycetes bacterium RBG_13_63_9]|nr:MAG: hypothetical protein A2V70_20275 [Planctomycetes bacterium RBG_13_63_9]
MGIRKLSANCRSDGVRCIQRYGTQRAGWKTRLARFEALEERTLLSVSMPDIVPAAAEADYLIIVAHDFYDANDPDDPLNRFADWKTMKGFKTYVAQIPSAGSYEELPSCGEIYDYIYNVYHTGTKASYVLIVGDDATVATRHFYDPDSLVPSNHL